MTCSRVFIEWGFAFYKVTYLGTLLLSGTWRSLFRVSPVNWSIIGQDTRKGLAAVSVLFCIEYKGWCYHMLFVSLWGGKGGGLEHFV